MVILPDAKEGSKTNDMDDQKIKIMPIGGVGEIGRNMMLLEYEQDLVIIDVGLKFPDSHLPGVDLILPDFSYVLQNEKKLKAILITHGHEDHIGGLVYLLKDIAAPVYATRLTLGLIGNKMIEHGLQERQLFHEVKPRDRVTIGKFRVEFINVNHSIAGCLALAINTPVGTVIHTGDIKIDSNPIDNALFDFYTFARYGEEGVLLLLSDSTNANRPGYTRSESITGKKINDIVAAAKGRVIIASFASNIHRIQQIIQVARANGRKIALSGLSMLKNVELARQLGYLEYEENDLIPLNDLKFHPDNKIAIITTGSQGEPLSALTRIANKKHAHIKAVVGDTIIISASIIPGNERAVADNINKLMMLGAAVEINSGNGIHVSGHASQEELKTIINITRPKFFMPVHGEYRHLVAHADLAIATDIQPENIIIAQNGEIIILDQNGYQKRGNIPANDIYVDGKTIGDIGSSVLKDRITLSENGIVFIVIVLSQDFFLAEAPRFVMRGFIFSKTAQAVYQEMELNIEKIVDKWRLGSRKKGLEHRIKSTLKKILFTLTGREPMIEVEIIRLEY